MRRAIILLSAAGAGVVLALASTLVFPLPSTNPASGSSMSTDSRSNGSWSSASDPAPVAVPSPAAAATPRTVALCPGREQLPLVDGRLVGYIPYADGAGKDLVALPKGFESASCQQIDREVKSSLTAMIAAAGKDDPQIGKMIMGVSCFRPIERQRDLFCNPAVLDKRGVAGQAKWNIPPGFSEHATGFAIDFGVRSKPECNASACFTETRTSKWLAQNAKKFGFEMSFPDKNKQGVKFEPWHWRWVGSDRAKTVFARARRDFPSP